MNKAFEKIIEKLEELKNHYHKCCLVDYNEGAEVALTEAMLIVQGVAEEYNGGWIPCSERLPSEEEYLKDDGRFIVTDGNRRYQSIYDIYTNKFRTLHNDLLRSWEYTEDELVIAWQPLPEPYKE